MSISSEISRQSHDLVVHAKSLIEVKNMNLKEKELIKNMKPIVSPITNQMYLHKELFDTFPRDVRVVLVGGNTFDVFRLGEFNRAEHIDKDEIIIPIKTLDKLGLIGDYLVMAILWYDQQRDEIYETCERATLSFYKVVNIKFLMVPIHKIIFQIFIELNKKQNNIVHNHYRGEICGSVLLPTPLVHSSFCTKAMSSIISIVQTSYTKSMVVKYYFKYVHSIIKNTLFVMISVSTTNKVERFSNLIRWLINEAIKGRNQVKGVCIQGNDLIIIEYFMLNNISQKIGATLRPNSIG